MTGSLAIALGTAAFLMACAGTADSTDGSGPLTGEAAQGSSELPAGTWRLTELDGIGASELPAITLAFDEAGASIVGRSGCNRYFTSFKGDAEALELGPIGATRMACEPGLMDIERAFLAALSEARAVRSSADVLELLSDDGDVLLSFHPDAEGTG